MATLNQIVTEIADALDRPFDTLFKERVKVVIKHERSTLIRQALNKYSDATLFKQRYTVAVQTRTKSDSSTATGGDTKRTYNKIYTPIRYNTDIPFNFVGNDIGTISFIYTELSELPYVGELPYNADMIRYTYRNGYIYLYASSAVLNTIDYISIEAPLEDPTSMISIESQDNINAEISYHDDMEFPMPDDLVQDIKARILSGELRITDSDDKVRPTHVDNE